MTTPTRLQMRRTKGWRKPAGAVYVGRPSRWGNWYQVKQFSEIRHPRYNPSAALVVVQLDKRGWPTGAQWAGFTDRAEATSFAVDLYRRALEATYLDLDGEVTRRYYLAGLEGRDLACWCPIGQPCHADVLLELANAAPVELLGES